MPFVPPLLLLTDEDEEHLYYELCVQTSHSICNPRNKTLANAKTVIRLPDMPSKKGQSTSNSGKQSMATLICCSVTEDRTVDVPTAPI